MPGNSMRENRETPRASGSSTPDRLEKATSYKTSAHASGESDGAVVPTKYPNNGAQHRRRVWREGCRPRRTSDPPTRTGLRAGRIVSQGLIGSAADVELRRHYSRQEPYALKCARTDLCGGRSVTGVPTATKRG
jgi:hypothetical protein